MALLWASFIWYWARVFYYIKYSSKTDLSKIEKSVITFTPRILGTLALVSIACGLLRIGLRVTGEQGRVPLVITGIVFLTIALLFFLFVQFRRKIFKRLGEIQLTSDSSIKTIPINKLPEITKILLFISTAISLIILILFIINPQFFPELSGNVATVLLWCFIIWIPLLYWMTYASLRMGFPLSLILIVFLLIFSFFNNNDHIRFANPSPERNNTINEYFNLWYNENNLNHNTIPLIIAIAEGGGIRATYWSASVLSKI